MKISEGQKQLIENNPVAIATVGEDNTPNVIAVASVKVVDDNLIITDNYMVSTVTNIQKNPKVCLAVWDKHWKGCKITGSVEYHSSGDWLDFVKGLDENKGYSAKGALVVKVEQLNELG